LRGRTFLAGDIRVRFPLEHLCCQLGLGHLFPQRDYFRHALEQPIFRSTLYGRPARLRRSLLCGMTLIPLEEVPVEERFLFYKVTSFRRLDLDFGGSVALAQSCHTVRIDIEPDRSLLRRGSFSQASSSPYIQCR
jgi:hypothetical protein